MTMADVRPLPIHMRHNRSGINNDVDTAPTPTDQAVIPGRQIREDSRTKAHIATIHGINLSDLDRQLSWRPKPEPQPPPVRTMKGTRSLAKRQQRSEGNASAKRNKSSSENDKDEEMEEMNEMEKIPTKAILQMTDILANDEFIPLEAQELARTPYKGHYGEGKTMRTTISHPHCKLSTKSTRSPNPLTSTRWLRKEWIQSR